jgi:tetratricopeptide (TPR) repeat protein
MDSKRWRIYLGRAALVVAGPVVFFAGVEGVLFLTGRFEPVRVLERVEHEGRKYWTTVPEFGPFVLRRSDTPRPQEVWLPVKKEAGKKRVVLVGESAAAGFPGSDFSLARLVDALWRERFPDQPMEVINLTMVGVNSHVLRVFVREAMAMEPDALVIYMGHNEVIGPYGPAGRLAGFYPAGWMAQASLAARNTRTGRFFEWASNKVGSMAGIRTEKWTGLDQFESARIAADDMVLDAMVAQTKGNVRAMAETALESGCKVLVCVPAVNLTDWPPLASADGDEEKSAMAAYEKAKKLQAEGGLAEAWKFYRQACDLDEMRFRADSRVRGVQREVVAEMASKDVMLVDSDIWLHEENPGPLTDRDFFLEHVHLTFEGRVAVAALMVDGVARLLHGGESQVGDAEIWWKSFPEMVREAKERTLFTSFDEAEILLETDELLEMDLFSEMRDLAERRERSIGRARSLRRLALQNFCAEDFLNRHALAESSNPTDPWVDKVASKVFLQAGHFQKAVEFAKKTTTKAPNIGFVRLGLCLEAIQDNRLDEALEHLREVERQTRQDNLIDKLYGEIYWRKGQPKTAEQFLRKHVDKNPDDFFGWANLALAQERAGDFREAVESYRKGLDLNPADALVLNNLSWILATLPDSSTTEKAQALKMAEMAVEINPFAHRYRGTLAVALFANNKIGQARVEASRAISMAKAKGDQEAAHELEKRLKEFTNVRDSAD